MGLGVLIIGKSGAGKSTSLRNFKQDEVGIINVISKPLPFKNVNNLKTFNSDDYEDIKKIIKNSKTQSIVIDDASYLLTNEFMRNHSKTGAGNAVYSMYNDIADHFWNLTEAVKETDNDKIVYFIMQEEKNDFGDIKPKTIGKLIDEKVCLEGLFSIVLRAKKIDNNYYFFTQATDGDVAKSPIGMFENLYIDNDLKLVDNIIRDFYGLNNDDNRKEKK